MTEFVDGATRLYFIVGDPIEQVRSPQTFTPRFHEAGRNALMLPVNVPDAGFEAILPTLKRIGNLDGIVATVPFKARLLAFADRILPTAMQVGAANALRREADGTWTADMFDGRGLVRGLAGRGHAVAGRSALVLGAGGAGSAVIVALAEAGAARLTVHDVARARAERIVAVVREAYPACAASVGPPDPAGHDMLVNASPVGMGDDARLPAAFGRLDPALLVFDVVTKPEVTPLLRLAADCGCTAFGGGVMLGGQVDEMLAFFGMAGRR